MEYRVLNNQNIFDVVNKTVYDLNLTYTLLSENEIPGISGLLIGDIIEYTPVKITPPNIKSFNPAEPIISKDYFSKANQTVYDITLQVYADLNKTYQLIKDSDFGNLLSYPIPRTIFKFNPQKNNDPMFSSFLKNGKIVLATRLSAEAVPNGASFDNSWDNSFENGN